MTLKKVSTLIVALVLTASLQAFAAGLITKATAETDALNAVGGGTVIQAVLERENGKQEWSVDITGATAEYEVKVDAHSGAILKIITQPLTSPSASLITKAVAESDALAAVGGGTVLQANLDTALGTRIWSVDIKGSTHEYEVWVDAHTGGILKIITQPLSAACTFISKAKAQSDALAAVGGGTVLLIVLESQDNPPVWSVDVKSTKGTEYEVKVNACTGAIVAIIVGG